MSRRNWVWLLMTTGSVSMLVAYNGKMPFLSQVGFFLIVLSTIVNLIDTYLRRERLNRKS